MSDNQDEIDRLAAELKVMFASWQKLAAAYESAVTRSGFDSPGGDYAFTQRELGASSDAIDHIDREISRLEGVKSEIENIFESASEANSACEELANAIEELGGDPYALVPGLEI